MEASLRLKNELSNIRKERPFGFYAKPFKRDIMHWNCQIHHNGFYFTLTMKFSNKYPMEPPVIMFNEKVYHPNVYNTNAICLDLLSTRWSPALTIMDLLKGISRLFDTPNPESPANREAAALYFKNREKYNLKVLENNRKFHSKYHFSKD